MNLQYSQLCFVKMCILGLLVLLSFVSFLVDADDTVTRLLLVITPLLMMIYLLTHVPVPRVTVTALDTWMMCCLVFVILALLE